MVTLRFPVDLTGSLDSVVNVGGEYVIEMHTANLTAAATGNIITPLPIACAEGQTQRFMPSRSILLASRFPALSLARTTK